MDWREAWRDHLAPQMTTEELEHLRRGVLADDPAIVRGAFWQPGHPADAPLAGGCLLMYGAWKAGYAPTVGVASALLVARCVREVPGEEDNPRVTFYRWADKAPRADVLRAFLPEVSRVLARRAEAAAPVATARPRKGVPA